MSKWSLVLVCVCIRYAYSLCDVDQFDQFLFGESCNFLCHCKDKSQCDDVTGECQNGCADHWMGPGCQYRDIARGKSALQLDTLDDKVATLAIDGNTSTCSMTNISEVGSTRSVSPFWRLQLGGVEAIRGLQITPSPETLHYFTEGFNITVENITGADSSNILFYPTVQRLCYSHPPDKSLLVTFEIMCDTYMFGNQLRIQLANTESQLALCDVKVYGGRNVAFKQTGSYSGALSASLPASLALDGYTIKSATTCTSTTTTVNHWWRVDFNQMLFVHSINIYKFNNDRIRGYHLEALYDELNVWSVIHQDIGLPVTTYLHFVTHTSSMRIFRPYKNKIRLCEVQLFGDCPEYKCGFDCSIECHCHKNSFQNKVSGNCSSDCLGRWWGYNRKCDKECPATLWGANCTTPCGRCFDDEPCDMVTGTCINGCADGYKASEYCKEECDDGHWGHNCSRQCGACINGSCDHTNGTCQGPCQPGFYHTSYCDTECPATLWGANCTTPCGHCFDDEPCDMVNGTCINGCADGYKASEYCKEECDDGHWGHNCSLQCGACTNGSCDHTNGTCQGPCQPGFYHTSHCDMECTNDTWGLDCNMSCGHCEHRQCDRINGTCAGQCKPGYKLTPLCVTECDNGTWGHNCSRQCGACMVGSCDNTNGTCSGLCQPGFYDTSNCDIECNNGTFGENCTEMCNSTCANGCNYITGMCLGGCNPGWEGFYCENECTNGTWGRACSMSCGHCQHQPCDKISGTCTGQCKPGYRSTPLCVIECGEGTWGQNCSRQCGACLNGSCDHTYGTCYGLCQPGFYDTSHCDIDCLGGYHGRNCTGQCGKCYNNTLCERSTGTCLNGCAGKYQGLLCMELIPESQSSSTSTPTIIGTTVGITFFVLCAVFLLFFFKPRQIFKRQPKETNLMVDWSKESDGLQYANLGHIDRNGSSENAEQTYSPLCANQNTGDTYQNIVINLTTGNESYVDVCNLKDYIVAHSKTSRFVDEFKSLPKGLQYPTEHALKQHNKPKNRYLNIYPYDDARVVLNNIHHLPDSDYINASYIDGHNRKQKYIAAQGPFQKVIDDFWRMIWERRINFIVMLTNPLENGKIKCLEYWKVNKYGNICVDQVDEEKAGDLVIRTIGLYSDTNTNGSRRKVTQMHFTAWPDKSIPDEVTGLVWFLHKCRTKYDNCQSPVLVHCSAGIGRTGTFIALDYLYDQGKAHNHVCVLDVVKQLRKQRLNMVQTKDQYAFLHEAVYVALAHNAPIKLCKFEKEYEHLCEVDLGNEKVRLLNEYEVLDEFLSSQVLQDQKSNNIYADSKLPENAPKNRFDNILAANKHRPFLSTHVEGCNNYINAVFVQSHKDPRGFIVSQSAMATTAVDCCRLVYEQEIKCIVTFDHELLQMDEKYLPDDGSVQIGPFKVTLVSTTDRPGYSTRVHTIAFKDKEQEVVQYIYADWNGTNSVPDNVDTFLDFLSQIREVHDDVSERKVLVQCQDGARKSGLFVVLMNVMESLQFDAEIAIVQIVRRARNRRRQIVANFDQYKFCYDLVLHHIQADNTYMNT